jgi:small-conductance mechanosensitive channel
MIYCIVKNISYSSSFSVIAIAGGIFLLRGSLGTASAVRWSAIFMLAGFVTLLAVWPFMQPLGLTLTQIRLNPGTFFTTMMLVAFALGLLLWLARELGREPIHTARASAGLKQRDMRIPAAIGVGLVLVIGIVFAFVLHSGYAERAKSMAEQQVGSGYQLHVVSLNVDTDSQGTAVSGVVIAWNEKEIRYVQVHWEDR